MTAHRHHPDSSPAHDARAIPPRVNGHVDDHAPGRKAQGHSTNRLPAVNAEFKPRTSAGTILIGTLETVTQLSRQLDAVGDCEEPLGCVIVNQSQSSPRIGTLPGPHNHNMAVLGSLDDLPRICDRLRPSAAVVSLPSTMSLVRLQVHKTLTSLGVECRRITPLGEVMSSHTPLADWWQPRAGIIDPAVLIDRQPRSLDRASVARVLGNKRVLITGAGGSIGSELARLAAAFKPEMLLLVERSENALFEIDRQLKAMGVPHQAILHDVVDQAGTRRLIEACGPHVVFHAAAHKHVPLMEDHPAHAITNNVFGTKSVADASLAAGVERFVLISTDKAVHPSSIMGATKRIAEHYVRWLHHTARNEQVRAASNTDDTSEPTAFSVVRFGNVLGSACSVLPIWSAQIAQGGPVTVTDPRMTRYFMTIPEAATLVMQAAAMSVSPGGFSPSRSPLYVLDMGEPIRIVELARRLIEQHGFKPRLCDAPSQGPTQADTIEIVFTGIRPGEKLVEELAYAQEQLRPTSHPGIRSYVAAEQPDANLPEVIERLDQIRCEPDAGKVARSLRKQLGSLCQPVLTKKAG